jgi:hypothetical protein
MKITTIETYSITMVENYPKSLFVFGENVQQQFTKSIGAGQAIIRGLANTFGFCTLDSIGKYWTDVEFELNRNQIDLDVARLKEMSKDYELIVFPYYGLGTGRARMQVNCPLTFVYMCEQLLKEFGYNNLENLISKNF